MSPHDHSSEISRKVWSGEYLGKYGALALGKTQYEEMGDRVAWMSTLYSALTRLLIEARRGDLRAFSAALWCVKELFPLVSAFRMFAESNQYEFERYTPAQCDVIATVLFRFATILPVGYWRYVAAAKQYASFAQDRAPIARNPETAAFSSLTLARIELFTIRKQGGSTQRDVPNLIEYAMQAADHIESLNQRSRAYRGIAEVIYAQPEVQGYGLEKVIEYLYKADLPGIDADVAAKNGAFRRELKLD
jgi:hypothetical protein